jgi:hypothetical protein
LPLDDLQQAPRPHRHPAGRPTPTGTSTPAVAPLALDHRALKRGLMALQRQAGNVAVSRLVVAREPNFGPGVGGQLMYGMSRARTAYVQESIDKADFAAAVGAMVTFLEEDNELDPGLLKNRTMRFEAGLGDDGAVSPPGFDYSTFPPKADPGDVRIGPGAFAGGVSYLHSVMMHEYQHVLGYQSQAGQQQGASGGAEVQAYAWEILNAKMTKLNTQPRRVAEQWEHLVTEYGKLTKPDAVAFASLARQAQRAAQTIVGGTATLSPLPAP